MQIETFSFRYGDNCGFWEWYRYNAAQGLWLDCFDGAMRTQRCQMTEAELMELAKIIRNKGIAAWDGFCRMDGICSGDGWALHITYREGAEIHAMGHSEAPAGFDAGKAALRDFFGRFF